MERELLISAGPGEWRAALLEDGVAAELFVERGDLSEAGSIHVGRVTRLVPALGAALVDIGEERPAFLPRTETAPRGRQLHEGVRVVVQVRREAQGGKAPRVTERLRLPLSRERGGGRPETEGITPQELERRRRAILDRASGLDPPARIEPARSFATALAAASPGTPDRIRVDDPAAVLEIRIAFPGVSVEHCPELDWPIDLDALFAEALSETLALSAGGSVHFAATRAGILIDVDSGTAETGSPERVALAINLAAAAAVARQIRLRNLGGGIVVDFIGLERRAARDRVCAALAEVLAHDPASPRILGWTRLGHLELVRPRRARPLSEALVEPRPGGALVKTAVTVAHEALRALRREARAQPGRRWRLTVAAEIASAFAGGAAPALRQAEQRFARSVVIETAPGYDRERFQISPM